MQQKGFTLIELIVVIGVLSVLSLFLLMTINPLAQFAKARDAQRKSDLGQMQKALEQYYQDNGKYPANDAVLYEIIDINSKTVAWGTPWTPYLDEVPQDPTTGRRYIYQAIQNQQGYLLYANLEQGPSDTSTCMATVLNCKNNPTNPQYCNCTNVPNVAGYCGTNLSPLPCNYGVSSPNTTP